MTPRPLETLIDTHHEMLTGKPSTPVRQAEPLTQDVVDELAAFRVG